MNLATEIAIHALYMLPLPAVTDTAEVIRLLSEFKKEANEIDQIVEQKEKSASGEIEFSTNWHNYVNRLPFIELYTTQSIRELRKLSKDTVLIIPGNLKSPEDSELPGIILTQTETEDFLKQLPDHDETIEIVCMQNHLDEDAPKHDHRVILFRKRIVDDDQA